MAVTDKCDLVHGRNEIGGIPYVVGGNYPHILKTGASFNSNTRLSIFRGGNRLSTRAMPLEFFRVRGHSLAPWPLQLRS